MYFNHSDSSTENLTLFIDNKKTLNVLNSILKRQLESQFSINLKLTTLQIIVAKSLGYNSHNDLVHSLSIEADVDYFVRSFVKQVNSTSAVKCSTNYLEKFNVSLRDAQLARKKLNIQQIKSNKKMPFFESMGERECDMPFPVRLFLDHQSNELYISKTEKQYSPPKLFFGIEEAFNIAPEISAAEAEKLLLDIQDEAEALLNESWIFWDGNNFRRESSERGNSIRNSLQIRIKNYLGVIS